MSLATVADHPSLPVAHVLIAYLDQLHDFVQQIPPLAWELLEHAQEPLEIVYPQRKPKLTQEGAPPEICVRWVRQPRLLKFVQKAGPQWARPVSTVQTPLLDFTTVDCYDRQSPYQRVKTVVIAADNTFFFLR